MGQFSWLDCVTGKQILVGAYKPVYVLVPAEFGGGHIKETGYDGYGNFGGYDIYELVADWNRNYIDPTAYDVAGIDDFCNGEFEDAEDEEELFYEYGDDFKRLIGIEIACDDEDNARLKYPIKITYDSDAVYEKCKPSPSDPNQGCLVAEPQDTFFNIIFEIPDGTKLNKRKINNLIHRIFCFGLVEGTLEFEVRNNAEFRKYTDESAADNICQVVLNTTFAGNVDFMDIDYMKERIYKMFEADGYNIVDVYADYE